MNKYIKKIQIQIKIKNKATNTLWKINLIKARNRN